MAHGTYDAGNDRLEEALKASLAKREPYWEVMLTREQRDELVALLNEEAGMSEFLEDETAGAWARGILRQLPDAPHGHYLD